MRMISRFAGFLHSDPDYAPFGIPWLKGLTLARAALVGLVIAIFSLRQGSSPLAAMMLGTPDWHWVFSQNPEYIAMQMYSALPMLLLVTAADNLSAGASQARRIGAFVAAVLLGTYLYVGLNVSLSDMSSWATEDDPGHSAKIILTFFSRALLFGGLLTAVLYFVTRERSVAQALHAETLTRLSLDRQMTEARLQVLQAQIEPHFLFNTLANIKRLYLIDPAHGRTLLRNLSDYLRAALPQMRESGSTLGRELALTRAYLNVLQVRMGARLKVEIAVPVELLDVPLPPMMLPTLVENAIKHGINPLPRGGTVKISAERSGATLKLMVADNGAGFREASGTGVGLANTRARLATLYGTGARLSLGANPGGGVVAAIELPFQAAGVAA